MPSEPTNIIRKNISRRRQQLDENFKLSSAFNIKQQVCNLRCYHHANKVALYLACNGEVDTDLIIDDALARGKKVYLPVLHHIHGRSLLFAPYDHNTTLRPNQFGIPEPVVDAKKLLRPRYIDTVITPLLAFDENCDRIGMGGGYYDRSFGFLCHTRQWQHPKLVGVAYELQKTDNCHPQPWDVTLHHVVTEKRLYSR